MTDKNSGKRADTALPTHLEIEQPNEAHDEKPSPLIHGVLDDWKQLNNATGKRQDREPETLVFATPQAKGDGDAPPDAGEGQKKGGEAEKAKKDGEAAASDKKDALKEKLPELNAVPDFSISRDHFDQLDMDTENALKRAGIDRLSMVSTRDGGKAVLIEFDKAKTVEMDKASGCRSLSLDKKTSFKVGQEKDGSVVISDIKGVKAVLDGEPPLDATITKVSFRKGKDGKPEMEIRGTVNGEERASVIKVDGKNASSLETSMKALSGLVELSKTGLFSKIPENVGNDVANADIKDPTNPLSLQKRAAADRDYTKQIVTTIGIAVAVFAGAKIGRNLLRQKPVELPHPTALDRNTGDGPPKDKDTRESKAAEAIDRTLKDAKKLIDETPASEKKGRSTIFPMEKVQLKLGDKTLEFDAVAQVGGKLYLRSAKDGMMYSAQPWLDTLKGGLKSRAEGFGPDAPDAKAALEKFNKSPEMQVNMLKSLASNFDQTAKSLPDAPKPAAPAAASEAPPVLARGRQRSGARYFDEGGGGQPATELASGQGDISGNRGGGFDVRGGGHGGTDTAKIDKGDAEEIARLRKEIEEDKTRRPEERERALRALDEATRSREAMDVVKRAKREAGRHGTEGGEGKAAALGMVILAIGSWYAMYKMNQVRDTYIPAATVN